MRWLLRSPRVTRAALLLALCALGPLAAATADVVTGGNVKVSFRGWISPRALPRTGSAPVSLHVGGAVTPLAGHRPETLRRVKVEFNRHGRISTRGLPSCHRHELLGTTTAGALERCRAALVGSGRFTARLEIPEGAPFPSRGRMLAFNATVHGHPALLAHVFGVDPVPTSQVLAIAISRKGRDGFGPTLSVQMPDIGREWGYVTGFEMTFHRVYRYRGRLRSFLSASCPAPAGIAEAPFRAARGTYYLAGGEVLSRIVGGSCQVRPGAGRS